MTKNENTFWKNFFSLEYKMLLQDWSGSTSKLIVHSGIVGSVNLFTYRGRFNGINELLVD